MVSSEGRRKNALDTLATGFLTGEERGAGGTNDVTGAIAGASVSAGATTLSTTAGSSLSPSLSSAKKYKYCYNVRPLLAFLQFI